MESLTFITGGWALITGRDYIRKELINGMFFCAQVNGLIYSGGGGGGAYKRGGGLISGILRYWGKMKQHHSKYTSGEIILVL